MQMLRWNDCAVIAENESRVSRYRRRSSFVALAALGLCLAACSGKGNDGQAEPTDDAASAAILRDASDGTDWPGYGRTYGEQHFSPLTEINDGNIGKIGLAWYIDLPPANAASAPIKVGEVLYFSTGYSLIHAVEAATGKELWTFDPKAAETAGVRLRSGWGSRGIAWWNGKIYTGTQDGRLIAIDGKTGKQLWSQQTLQDGDYRFISGAPRAFAGKIIVGHGGADTGQTRGYVTAYDAETGRQLWRFFTVPGDPSKGFENDAMKMAAKTWAGEWWKHGGGGTVWNAITYDADTDTIFLGTGNGAPWNHKIRSEGKGDNLFLSSIVALNAKTGAYKWHYQIDPGETWDYNAAMDMQLADLEIDGKQRKVLIQAPKNGFLYVIDRISGKLISAGKLAQKITWASDIDIKTGRPIETPGARFPNGASFDLWPSNGGAHSWSPSAYSPLTRLVYVPVREVGMSYDDKGIDPKTWKFQEGNFGQLGLNLGPAKPDRLNGTSALVAWDPVAQKAVWRRSTPGVWNGGLLATAGNLVFQGQGDGVFNAYDSRSGKPLWSFKTQAGVLAPPITYRANGRQYVSVLVGVGTSAGIVAAELAKPVDYRSQPRRMLTFALEGKAVLPAYKPVAIKPAEDRDYVADAASAARGAAVFARCLACHGMGAIAAGAAPDLRASPVPADKATFEMIVHGGALTPNGMPKFDELTPAQLADLRQYIRAQSAAWREGKLSKGH